MGGLLRINLRANAVIKCSCCKYSPNSHVKNTVWYPSNKLRVTNVSLYQNIYFIQLYSGITLRVIQKECDVHIVSFPVLLRFEVFFRMYFVSIDYGQTDPIFAPSD